MKNLKRKNILLFSLILISVFNFVFAGCGGCQVQAKPTIKKSNSLVTTIPESGKIEGFAIASCGMCNFAYKDYDVKSNPYDYTKYDHDGNLLKESK